MTNLTGKEIVNVSKIGQIADDVNFLDGRTMADYKSILAKIADKAIAMIPAAVKQAGKEDAKIALDEMYRKAVSQTWKGSLDYWTTNQKGDKAIRIISRDQVGDITRILCNMIDQA